VHPFHYELIPAPASRQAKPASHPVIPKRRAARLLFYRAGGASTHGKPHSQGSDLLYSPTRNHLVVWLCCGLLRTIQNMENQRKPMEHTSPVSEIAKSTGRSRIVHHLEYSPWFMTPADQPSGSGFFHFAIASWGVSAAQKLVTEKKEG